MAVFGKWVAPQPMVASTKLMLAALACTKGMRGVLGQLRWGCRSWIRLGGKVGHGKGKLDWQISPPGTRSGDMQAVMKNC